MRNILTLSKREITRLRARFSGRSRFMVPAIVLLTVVASLVIYQNDMAVSKGLYNVGVSPAAPEIADQRFNVTEMSREDAHDRLQNGTIDLYLDGSGIVGNDSERSGYARGAIQQYLEKWELLRVAEEYEIDQAFPLRIQIDYLNTEDEAAPIAAPDPDNLAGAPPALLEQAPQDTESPLVALPPDALPETEISPAQPITASETVAVSGLSDDAVRQQLEDFTSAGQLPEFKAEFLSEEDIIIPSLMTPPIPLAQVIITFLYVVPVFFISLFFTSSFTEEKVNRKLIVLLSAPVTRLQVIFGKMLPYLVYSICAIIVITLLLKGNVLLGLAIFVPVMLFIFSIYLMVALTYRTFKDQTFFSVLALSVITVYLVGPAMFTGVSDMSHISPLTMAVLMFRGESFGASEYFLSTTPLFIVFGSSMFVGSRVLNEEYLMGFRPLHVKITEALYLVMDKAHRSLSVFLLSVFLVPLVFMVELAAVALVANMAVPLMIGLMVIAAAVIEEIAKSAGVVVLLQNRVAMTGRRVLLLAGLSALGFLLAEKLLLFLAMSVVSESMFLQAMFDGGYLLLPLVLHAATTAIVCMMTWRLGTRFYPAALAAGSIIHIVYNLMVLRMAL